MSSLNEIKSQIQHLSFEECGALRKRLNEKYEVEAEWSAVVQKRVLDCEEGRVETRSADEVHAELRRKYDLEG